MKMKAKSKPLETERLMLREIRESDAMLLVQWRSVPEIYQYFLSPKPITLEQHLEWYFNCYREDRNRIDFMAVEKVSGQEKGVFHIKRSLDNVQCSEIGYRLDKSAQGKGYAQEGIKRLMVFVKSNWKCKECAFYIHEKNRASRILAERLGYIKSGRKGSFILYGIDLENILGGGGYKLP